MQKLKFGNMIFTLYVVIWAGDGENVLPKRIFFCDLVTLKSIFPYENG